MSLDPEVVLDRRRLKRRLFAWRTIAFLAVLGVLGLGYAAFVDRDALVVERDQIARVTISGFIRPDRKLVDLLKALEKDNHVKGVIVALETPGGATSGGEQIYEAVRSLAKVKPTVASVDSLATSAGYMIALGADRIVARRTALTGSIGVIAQWPDVSRLLDTIGVKYDEVKSSPMKAEPTPFKPISPEARAMLDRSVRDTYEWFVGLVAERRGLSSETAHELADGRVVTGHQALEAKLIDEIGGESVAIDWLATRGVNKNLKVRDRKPRADSLGFGSAESLARQVTRGALGALGLSTDLDRALSLDGLTSVWHPSQVGTER